MAMTRANLQKYPTVDALKDGARKGIPRFAFDYIDGAVGHGETCNIRNQSALSNVQLIGRNSTGMRETSISATVFGQAYGSPLGISPMGLPSLTWPGGERALAVAAQKANIPFVLGMAAGAKLEDIGALAPDVLWFQIHRIPRRDMEVNRDLLRRAASVGVKTIVLTVDLPARGKRPRELKNGLLVPFRIGRRNIYDASMYPRWLFELSKHGFPKFVNFYPYVDQKTGEKYSVERFVHEEIHGAFSWSEMEQLREVWPYRLVIKGILHPDDAAKAVEIGADAVIVSNHGGRQLEASPPTIEMLPRIVSRVGRDIEVFMDGGVRSGVDIARALVLGAKSVFAGRPFMYALGALGKDGPAFVIDMLNEELRVAMMQLGIENVEQAGTVPFRFGPHGEWTRLA